MTNWRNLFSKTSQVLMSISYRKILWVWFLEPLICFIGFIPPIMVGFYYHVPYFPMVISLFVMYGYQYSLNGKTIHIKIARAVWSVFYICLIVILLLI